MGRSVEGQEVMLADRVKSDVLENDHLVVAFLKTGCQLISRVLVQAGEELGVHPGDSLGGVLQSFAVDVFANRANDRGNGLADLRFVDQLIILPSVQALWFDVARFANGWTHCSAAKSFACPIIGDSSTLWQF